MNRYRDYLQTQQLNKEVKRKKSGWFIIVGMMILAIVFYVGLEMDVEKLLKKVMDGEWGDYIETLSKSVVISNDRELPIYSVDMDEKKVALSFDAAWGAEDFDKIMQILDKHKVKVTFFMTGGWVSENEECVKILVKKGHDLGNHSEHHYDMTTIDKGKIDEEIDLVHDKVKEIADYDMKLFRAPYGAYNDELINEVKTKGYYPIQWSVDSLDWKDYGKEAIIDKVCNNKALQPGAIILCHNGAKYTASALDEMLTNLEKKGYEIVPISELIIKEDYTVDVTGKQVKNK